MKIVYALILCVLLSLIYAQSANAQLSHEYFIKVNTATGAYHIIDSLPGVRYIRTGLSCTAIDRAGGRYFFDGLDAANTDRFYTIDVHTGAILSNPATAAGCSGDNFGQFFFDDSTRKLYGIHWSACDQREYFVSIDENTGALQIIDSIPGVRYVAVNFCAYDQVHHHYFFLGISTSGSLYTIDALTGQVIYDPPVAQGLNQIQYDNNNATLYGVANDTFFVKVDPATSDTTILGHIPITGLYALPSYEAFDEVHQHYILAGEELSGQGHLLSVNVANAALVQNPPFAPGNNTANIIEIKYDDNDTTLYAIRWGPEEASIFYTSISKTICAAGTYQFGDSLLSLPGIYRDTLTSVGGYDSVITLQLDTTNIFTDSVAISVCGASFIFGTDTLTADGIYTDTLTAQGGCDSIVTLTLTLLEPKHVKYTVSICDGSGYVFGQNYLRVAGVYRDTFPSTNGCDSITTLTLIVDPQPAQPVIIAQGDSIQVQSALMANYQWQLNGVNIPGDIGPATLYSHNGDYTVIVTDTNGCTSTSNTITIINAGISDISGQPLIRLYPNPNNGSFTLEASGSEGRQYSICDMLGQTVAQGTITSSHQQINKMLSSGIYTLHLTGANTQLKFIVEK